MAALSSFSFPVAIEKTVLLSTCLVRIPPGALGSLAQGIDRLGSTTFLQPIVEPVFIYLFYSRNKKKASSLRGVYKVEPASSERYR